MFSLLKLDVNETVLRTYLPLLPFPSLVAQMVKNLPAMQETWVRSMGWIDPLENGTAPTPVFWPREFHGLYRPWGSQRVEQD